MRHLVQALVLAVCALPGTAHAQPLSDPMRPAASSGEAAAKPAGEPARGGLQATLTSPRRHFAVIDGKLVPLGGEARDGTLVGVTDSMALIRKNGARDVLHMHPGIEKKKRP